MSEKMNEEEIKEAKMRPSSPDQELSGNELPRGAKKFGAKKRRGCGFCMSKIATPIDYKDTNRLKKYLTEKGKIISRRQTGLCANHQREITNAVKRARQMSLI